MSFESWNYRKAGIWFVLTAFVLAAIIMPAANPAAVVTLTFALFVILQVVSLVSPDVTQHACAGYRFGIRPRSPPSC
jgi:hypothetical protein